jgi:error-prone DNA polymerase
LLTGRNFDGDSQRHKRHIWPALVETQCKALLGSGLLAVYGVAQRLEVRTALLGRLAVSSRNFH